MAIIQNGSSLFTGDAGSGPSEIRRYLITSDLIEAIVQLPTDLFYNTGIATYIWLITKGKAAERKGRVQLIDASKCFVKRRKNIGNKRVDLSDDCIRLITEAYNAFGDKTYTEGGLLVESKVFENDFFGYTKVTVETPVCDEKGNPVLKKGKPQPDKAKSDTEIIPLSEDIDGYFAKNVLPYNPIAYMDRSKDKIGYEIPFTRLFYKFTPPRKSDEIFAEFKALSAEEADLMKEDFGRMKKDPEKKIHKVQWRGGFSDRNGINKIPTTIQLKDFDNRTRIALGNFFLRLFNGEIYINPFGTFFNDETCEKFLKCLISEVYCEPLIDFCYRSQYKEDYYKEYIKPTIMEQNYADILTLLEFLVEFSSRYDPNFNVPPVYLTTIKQEISEEINYIFESEFVGYRVVDDIITPISDGVEIQTIQDGLDVEFGGCRSHIHKALAFFI